MNQLIPYNNWVVTYLHDKVPLNPFTGRKADVTDPTTWGDFGTANACVSTNQFLTLGFVLTNSPFSCMDLDTYKTTDPSTIQYHKQLYETFDTYSELSPSGGVHLWCEGKLPIDGKRLSQQHVELYCNKRYITVTRNSLNGHKIENRQPLLESFVKSIEPAVQRPKAIPEPNTDDEICTMAARAMNGELFKQLYLGDWQSKYPSQSEADQAFVNIVAFYTDSMEQVARIFHNSKLGKRKKALRLDYLYDKRYGIIHRAFDQKLPNVYFKDIVEVVKNKVHEEALKAISVPVEGFEIVPPDPPPAVKPLKNLPEFVKQELDMNFADFPVGLTGEIARFIYRNSVRPVKEIAIAGAIALMAGITGKLYNISEMGLNHYIAILAPTGTGKEGAAVGIERLMTFCKDQVPNLDSIMGPHEIASPQALIRHLSTVSPCCVSRKEEMGFWIEKICHKRANENNAGLRALLLALYTSSGKGKVYRETIRADSKKDTPVVVSPAFTLYGDSTPDIFYASLDEGQLDQGLISRFLIIECECDKEFMFNEYHDRIVPDRQFITRLVGLMQRSLRFLKDNDVVVPIQMTADVAVYLTKFREECDQRVIENPQATESIVYSRAHERLLRLAGVVAVGVNPDCPTVTMDIAQWAKKFIVRTMGTVILRFERGEVGEANLYLQQQQAMKKILKNYWTGGFKEELLTRFNINKEMFENKLITNNYLNTKMRAFPAFRKARNTSQDFNNVLLDFCKNGILVRIDMGKVRESFRTGLAYLINDISSLES